MKYGYLNILIPVICIAMIAFGLGLVAFTIYRRFSRK